MNKQEVIERLNNKLGETFAFQRNFEPLTWSHMECESKANAYMTAINYVEQLDEPQKVKVKQYVADWFEEHKDFLELSLGRITPDIRTKIVQGQALSEFEKWVNSTRNEPFETIIRMKNGYEVEEADKWMVKSNQLYFTGVTQLIAHDPLTYNFVKDQKHAHIFDDKKSAEKEASYFNGTVEKVGGSK